MNYDKSRQLIRKLRQEKKMSQEALAEKIYCDRTMINKIENGTRNPNIEELYLISDVLGISFEELIAGKLKKDNNEEEIKKGFKNYLKQQNTRLKRFRLYVIILLTILIIGFCSVMFIYFIHNYSSIKVYRFYGSSQDYKIKEGLLVITKDKIYFNINNIYPLVEEISIYSEINNEKKLNYKGNPNNLINDLYGYNSFIDYNLFIKGKQNIYVVVEEQEIKLVFEEDFVNDKIVYEKKQNITETEDTYDYSIPKTIKEQFVCENGMCTLEKEKESLIFNSNVLTVVVDDTCYTYDIENKILNYQNNKKSKDDISISILEQETKCLSGNCGNKDKIYNNFYQNYIKKYLE